MAGMQRGKPIPGKPADLTGLQNGVWLSWSLDQENRGDEMQACRWGV
ncbi:hypothetical protein DEDE109153_11385 [Deinococcus deserti]